MVAPMKEERSTPRSVMRIVGSFEALAQASRGLSLGALSSALNCPKSSLLTILRPLVSQGYLVQQDGIYKFGPAIFSLSSAIMASRQSLGMIRAVMEELSERTSETIFLAHINREIGSFVYVEVIESSHGVRYSVPVATIRPLYVASGGLALLAYQDRAWVEEYIETTRFSPLTPRTVTEPGELRMLLSEVRRNGYATSSDSSALGASGIASPLFNRDGSVDMALVVGAPTERFLPQLPLLRPIILDAAAKASSILGGVRPKRKNTE